MYGYGYQYGNTILGGGGGNPSAALFAAYKSRVETDGGVVENDSCTITFIDTII